MDRDRTYRSAVALRNWFREHDMLVSGINVVTEDLHARRTRLLFQKAFGNEVHVGIIAVPHLDYPANQWWLYSEGVKDVVSESAAYVYARFLFWPPLSTRLSPVGKREFGQSRPTLTCQANNPANLTRTIATYFVIDSYKKPGTATELPSSFYSFAFIVLLRGLTNRLI